MTAAARAPQPYQDFLHACRQVGLSEDQSEALVQALRWDFSWITFGPPPSPTDDPHSPIFDTRWFQQYSEPSTHQGEEHRALCHDTVAEAFKQALQQLSELEDHVLSLEDQVAELTSQLAEVESDLEYDRRRLKEAEDQVSELEDQLANLQTEA